MGRTLSRIVTTPPAEPGFIGEGHTAVEVVRPDDLGTSDPFVLLMDDRLEMPEQRQIGGAHPHAGLETVTLVLEGTLVDRDEGALAEGDLVWMTAGRGIIHNEAVEAQGTSRVLQLWIALPSRDRDFAPRFEVVRANASPTIEAPGVRGRLYSGSSNGQHSATQNRVAVTMLELAFEPGASFAQGIPASYNGFVYVVEGSIAVGAHTLERAQVGWFAPLVGEPASKRGEDRLELVAGPEGARIVLYAGVPLGEPIIQHGPFVAHSTRDISEYYQRFRAHQFIPMSEVARQQRAERPS